MSKKTPIIVIAFAMGALTLFVALAVVTGAIFATWHGRQISRDASFPQAPRYALPAGWSDPEKRGQIASLCAAGGHIFAAGPGLGVYRSLDGRSWLPFSAGLPEQLDTTHLASGPAGLFVIDDDLKAYRWDSTAWESVGVVPEASRVVRIGHTGDSLAVATDSGMRFWSRSAGWTQPTDPWKPTTFSVGPRRQLPTMPSLGVAIESNERGAWIVRMSGGAERATIEFPEADPSRLVWVRDADTAVAVVDGAWRSTITDVVFRSSPTPAVVLAAGDARVYTAEITEAGLGAPRPASSGLPPSACTSLTANGDDLFVGTAGFGVYRFDAARDRFEPANLGLLHTP